MLRAAWRELSGGHTASIPPGRTQTRLPTCGRNSPTHGVRTTLRRGALCQVVQRLAERRSDLELREANVEARAFRRAAHRPDLIVRGDREGAKAQKRPALPVRRALQAQDALRYGDTQEEV